MREGESRPGRLQGRIGRGAGEVSIKLLTARRPAVVAGSPFMILRKLLADASWAERKESSAWLVGLTTFGILVLELALIRWTSGQVRVFAYVNNIVLITAFLGLGVGVALGRRYPGLVHLVLPVLLLVALPVAAAETLGLVHLTFPDQSITLWGAETVNADPKTFVRNLAIFLGLLSGLGLVFVCAGAPLGHLF